MGIKYIKAFIADAAHLLHPEHEPRIVFLGFEDHAVSELTKDGAGTGKHMLVTAHVPTPPPRVIAPQTDPHAQQIAALQAQIAALQAAPVPAPAPPAPAFNPDQLAEVFAAFGAKVTANVVNAAKAAAEKATTTITPAP